MIFTVEAGTERVSVEVKEDIGRATFRELAGRLLALRQEDTSTAEVCVSMRVPDGEGASEETGDAVEDAPKDTPKDTTADAPDQPRTVRHTDALKRYSGFLLVECRACGTRKAYNAKTPIVQHRCVCGEWTQLEPLAKATAVCSKCEKTWRYRTNICDADLDLSCLNCGASMHLWWDAKKKQYRTIL